MAYSKIHTNVNFVNNQAPALNAANMNYIDQCVDGLDDRIVAMDTAKVSQTQNALAIVGWSVDNATGNVTLTHFNGSSTTVPTNLNKVAMNVEVVHGGEHDQQLKITYPDGTSEYVDLSAFVTNVDFADSTEVHFFTADGKTKASIIDGSISDSKLESGFLASCQQASQSAEGSKVASATNKFYSEGFAVGKQDGVDVGEDSPYWHNNAKYYCDRAKAIASSELAGLNDVSIQNPSNGQALVYDSEDSMWINEAIHGDVTSVAGKTGVVTLTKSDITDFPSAMPPTSHTHTKSQITDFPTTMTPSAHNQAASTITAGTLGGSVVANATAVANLSTKQVRNIYAGTTALTEGVTALTSGDIYIMYE